MTEAAPPALADFRDLGLQQIRVADSTGRIRTRMAEVSRFYFHGDLEPLELAIIGEKAYTPAAEDSRGKIWQFLKEEVEDEES